MTKMFKSKRVGRCGYRQKGQPYRGLDLYIYGIYGVYSNDISCTLTLEVRAADIDFTGPREW